MGIKKMWDNIFVKYLNKRTAAVILILGVLLMCIPTGARKKQEAPRAASSQNTDDYIRNLEKRLSSILSTIGGVSDVSVMITASDSGISSHERDKTSNNGESSSALSLKSQGSGKEEPVLVKKSYPSVLGVIVTAKGAESAVKNAEILSAVKAVLDVSAHRVTVLAK